MRSVADLRALALAVGLALAAWLTVPVAAEAGCSVSVSSAAFGPVDAVAGAVVNTTATLSFSCTGMVPIVPVTLCPNLGSGSGGNDGAGGRRLVGPGGATLAFQIYQDAARTQPWGSSALLVFGAVPTITVVPNLGGAASTTRTLYASVVGAAGAPPGTYSSTFSNQDFFWGLNLLTCAGVTVGNSLPPAPFTFEAPINPNCSVSAGPMSFGDVGLIDHVLLAQNAVTVLCTATTPWSLSLNNGATGTAPDTRYMTKGASRVRYGIYRDSDRTLPWGDAGSGLAVSGTGTGASQPIDSFGKAMIQATPSPGFYSDTIVVTLTY